MKRWIIVLVVALLGGGAGAWWWWKAEDQPKRYRTARVERGELVQSVRATGIVQPIRTVQVGTQVTGPIRKLLVDFNSRVKAGDLVAQIDPTVYEARQAQDQANLRRSEAALDQARARSTQADKELARAQELVKRDLVSQSDLDAALAERDALAAQVKVAAADIEQNRAALRVSQANLDYTAIRSPVDGVVIARNVDEGQTVVSSLSAQTIFLIATDLRKVQVQASIPEADIGKMRVEQPVTFTVDAYDEEFRGKVSAIRLAAVTVQNVVTYPVIIEADNPNEKLFPGMTANLTCEVARRSQALKLANAALRFRPDEAAKAGGKPAGQEAKRGAGRRGDGPRVWVQEQAGAPPSPVPVRLGITDGTATELLEPAKLAEGQEVIVGLQENGQSASGVVNPFTPQFPSGARRTAR